jgi:hypothetical protein
VIVKGLDQLVDRHPGECAVIFGAAPSLELVSDHKPGVGLYVGDSMLRTNLRAAERYYVRATYGYPSLLRKRDIRELESLKARWVLAESVMESNTPVRELLENHQPGGEKVAYVFDQRHFNGSACIPPAKCCQVLVDEDNRQKTIQEILVSYSGISTRYSTGSTVALHAFSLAIIQGCKEIHIAGVEIPKLEAGYTYGKLALPFWKRTSRGFFDYFFRTYTIISSDNFLSNVLKRLRRSLRIGPRKITEPSYSVFHSHFDEIINDFVTIASAAKAVGCEVFICSHTSNLLGLEGLKKCPLI